MSTKTEDANAHLTYCVMRHDRAQEGILYERKNHRYMQSSRVAE